MEHTKIEWVDHSWSPWLGCTKVSPGCANCYAEVSTPTRVARSKGVELWGRDATRRVMSDEYWRMPLRWNERAKRRGVRESVFPSQCDVFEEREDLVGPRERFFELVAETPYLDWLLLTKRTENLNYMLPWTGDHAGEYRQFYWPNVWVGTSVENQTMADKRIPELLHIPAAVRFLSCEPLLGAVVLSQWLPRFVSGICASLNTGPFIDWVIVGGESGPGARWCSIDAVQSVVNQCWAASVPCFVKQLGREPRSAIHPFEYGFRGSFSTSGGDWRWHLADEKGGDVEEWPESLRVREMPVVGGGV